jgi:hypothetical protein
MATTTNYGWTTPDDTALVKDGAAAIRTLGSSVDTTTKALNPSTTLGDIEYRSSTANTNTRLGIGTSGQVLAVSGGVPAWTTSSSGGMTLISTTTLSSASVVISSIPQTYNDLVIVIGGVTGATSNQAVRISPNGSDSQCNSRYVQSGVNSSVDERIMLTGQANTSRTSANNAWSCTISNYASTTQFKPFSYYGFFFDDSANNAIIGGGAFRSTTAISSLTFTYSANSFSTGTVLLYGVK